MDIILAHRQLDFDALASMVAAQKIYPDSVLVMDGNPNVYGLSHNLMAKAAILRLHVLVNF